MKLHYILCSIVLSLVLATSSNAQDTPAEVGLRLKGYRQVGIIYKTPANDIRWHRIRVDMLNMHALRSRNREVGAGIGYGQEKRKMLKDEIFEFFHGPEGYTSLLFGRDEGYRSTTINLAIGYVIGLQHHLTEGLVLGAEWIPSFVNSISVDNDGGDRAVDFDRSISLRGFAVTIAMRL